VKPVNDALLSGGGDATGPPVSAAGRDRRPTTPPLHGAGTASDN